MIIGKLRLGVGETIFSILFIVGSAMTWASAQAFSENPDHIPATLFLGMFLGALAYGLLAIIEPINRWAVRALLAIGFLLAVPMVFSGGLYLGLPAALLAVLVAEVGLWRARRVRDALRRPLLVHTARRAVPLYFSAVSVVLTAIVFLSPIGTKTIADPLPEPLIRFSVRLADPLLRPLLGYSIQGSIDDILISAITAQLPAGDRIDPRLLQVQREQFSERFGIELTGEDTIADVIVKLARQQMEKFEVRLERFYKAGFFLGAFFLFQLAALPFSWITILLLLAVVSLLRLLNIAGMKTAPLPATTFRWKEDMHEEQIEVEKQSETTKEDSLPNERNVG